MQQEIIAIVYKSAGCIVGDWEGDCRGAEE